MPDAPPRPDAAHALSIYAEPLAAGRRVVVVGDASRGIGERLAAGGARGVHVYDPDRARAHAVAKAPPRGVTVRDLPEGDFDIRDGAFDLAIVPDLGAVADPAGLMVRLRRLVGVQGSVLVSARNADAAPPSEGRPRGAADSRAIGYYELYDLVSLQFSSVRMIGQLPFAGVAIAELGESDDDIAVTVDTQLAPADRPPSAFIALGAQRDVRLDPYAIIQLPDAESLPAPDSGELARARLQLAEATVRVELVESQLQEMRDALTKATADESRARDLEARLAEHVAKARDAESRAGDNHVRAERFTHEIRKLEEELQRQRDRNFRLTRDVEDEKKARQKAELELGMVRKNPELSSARERISYLEEALRASEEVANALQARIVEVEGRAPRAEDLAALARELDQARGAMQAGRALQAALADAQLVVERAENEARAQAERAARAERMLQAMEQELAQGGHAEHGSLEAALRERAHTIHALEHELVRRERIIHELVAAMDDLRQGSHTDAPRADAPAPDLEANGRIERLSREVEERTRDLRAAVAKLERVEGENAALRASFEKVDGLGRENATLRSRLDALALEAARREGDVHTTTWRIAELEQQVASLEQRRAGLTEPAPSPELAARLQEALEQVDVLRQALAQEHDALRRIESGEELRRARAELHRQSVLIEQLSRELGRSPGPDDGNTVSS